MIYLISGQSGSGKSSLAEQIMTSFDGIRYYAATMQVYDEEGKQRVLRHRKMRENKGFVTMEQPVNINQIEVTSDSSVLLECLSNLLANEMFEGDEVKDLAAGKIIEDVKALSSRVRNLVIVTNEVFSDGKAYDEMTMQYIRQLGDMNQQIAGFCDVVIEAVYGIAVYVKKKEGMVKL